MIPDLDKDEGPSIYYVGVMSSNEFYDDLRQQVDSYFEISTRMIGGKNGKGTTVYTFDKMSNAPGSEGGRGSI